MPTVKADVVADVADRLFAAIENGDAATVEALWDDDVLVWKSAEPEDQAKKRALRVIAWFMDTTTDAATRSSTGSSSTADSSSSTSCTPPAATADRSRCGSASLSSWEPNGLINRIDEYFDPAELAPLLHEATDRRRHGTLGKSQRSARQAWKLVTDNPPSPSRPSRCGDSYP